MVQGPWRAATNRRQALGFIHHSVRRDQFCAHDYPKLLVQFGMQSSMSRKGYDDTAPIESFDVPRQRSARAVR